MILLYLFFLVAAEKQAGPVNSGGDAKPSNQMDAFKKEQLKKDLGKRMSGNEDIFNVAYKKCNYVHQNILMFHYNRILSLGLLFSS